MGRISDSADWNIADQKNESDTPETISRVLFKAETTELLGMLILPARMMNLKDRLKAPARNSRLCVAPASEHNQQQKVGPIPGVLLL
ncbi:MAG: hypothetical protein K5905_09925 [Roseibium sp.]|uniref:hypothetical protein n=1 Tax=Roseibium sp. TaxID=1936156 RepID=UPI00260C1A25|nr:hypothetical protein [Roseibium sp.]MCV0425781.1 hypothetical protein [Roseibium sp.]